MAFAELHELEARLEWDLSDAEKRVGQTTLDDLTVEAQHLGQSWSRETVPPYVRKCVLAAAVRYMKNLEGVIQSRAGDETLIFPEAVADEMGSAHFSKSEIEGIVSSALGPSGFGTVPILNMGGTGDRRPSGYVPVDYAGKPFPFFAENGW